MTLASVKLRCDPWNAANITVGGRAPGITGDLAIHEI